MDNRFFTILMVLGIVLISGCVKQPTPPKDENSTLKTEPINLSGVKTEKLSFIKYYSLNPLDITLQVPQYNLPLQTNQISNFNDFSKKIPLSSKASNLLEKNGFVVVDNPFNSREEYITKPYKTLKDKEIPVFITSDSLLHLYHIQFDETLRQIEEREFYGNIWVISNELLKDSVNEYNSATGDLKEASKRNVAYFAVGLMLLKPTAEQLCKGDKWECEGNDAFFTREELNKYTFEVPDFVKEDVEKELKLIEKHEGFSASPLFIYKEDYSQYIPRGHYTRSEKLKNYFKAFMWYGRVSMLLKGTDQVEAGKSCNDFPPCKALISLYDARIQTMQAGLTASKFAGNKDLMDKWDRIYSVTAFYVGLSDDLGPYEYIESLNSVFGDSFDPNDLTEENVGRLKAKLAEYRTPEIYGGTGDCVIWPPFTPEQADECLEATQGFRLMGQRFIPDSYMFSNLVSPYVGMYSGSNEPFTMCMTEGGPARCFPRGLDIMALLGSTRARELLEEYGDTEYSGMNTSYEIRFEKLGEEFNGFNESEWNKNLYWSWLFTLKPLLKEYPEGYPTFMQTKTWQDKELTTALASWTELRHDTILYAKQSYTMKAGSAIFTPPDKPVVGYIEPVPEFYNRLLALTRMTTEGLDEMDVLDNSAKHRLQNLEKILERLVDLSERELENKELGKEDYDFIKNFGDELSSVIAEVDDKAKKTTIVADVHTDGNTLQVLEEGVGYVNLVVVAYKVPDGRVLVGAGPVMSYYEFKHPMKDRLTDEKWRDLLKENPPEEPEWISNFADVSKD
ncbi:MAG: DUF3160 domain-containing protein [Candidatus Altiarchaeota archaeon]|nr:DUF3160 domain-containing protein [Candidatus Altiarchaeota archaeon]